MVNELHISTTHHPSNDAHGHLFVYIYQTELIAESKILVNAGTNYLYYLYILGLGLRYALLTKYERRLQCTIYI